MKFFIQFFLTIIILFILWVSIVFLQTSNATKTSQWVYDVYDKKTKIANDIKEKKLLIVSGSNALFGCNSKKLSNEFKIPVVNFGVNAGVLLPYTLFRAKQVINENDIVLMPLEYSMFVYDGTPNEQMIDYIFSRDINAFFILSLKEQFYMLWNITFDRLYRGYKAEGGETVTRGLYGSHNIDKYGDQIKTSKKYRDKNMLKELDALKANHYGLKDNQNNISWEYLENFMNWCKDKNVKVIFMPTTLMWFDSYKTDTKERLFYENLPNKIINRGWEFVGEPYKYMYDKSLYLNTDFHLTEKGKEMRTKQMINDLKPKLCNRDF